MLGRHAVPLAGIVWSYGIIALVLQSGAINEGRPTDTRAPSSDPLALAVAVLRASDRFSAAAVGYAGITPNEVLAWRVIFHSPNRDNVFKDLLATASVPGQLYALAGLQLGDSVDFLRAAGRLRSSAETVRTARGCIVTYETVADVVKQIEQGDWSREYVAGRLLPALPRRASQVF